MWLVPSQDNTFIHYLSSKHEGRSVVSGWPLTLLTSLTLGMTMCTVVYIDNRAIMVFIRFCDFWTLETSSTSMPCLYNTAHMHTSTTLQHSALREAMEEATSSCTIRQPMAPKQTTTCSHLAAFPPSGVFLTQRAHVSNVSCILSPMTLEVMPLHITMWCILV